jgi:hypothetical protein
MIAEEDVIDGTVLVLHQEEAHNNNDDEMSDFDGFDDDMVIMADDEGHYACEKVRNFYRNCRRLEAKDATLTQLHLFTWDGRFDVDLLDRLAIILGSVLFQNGTLQLLTVKVGPTLTVRGAKALRQGVASCKALKDVRIYVASEDVNSRLVASFRPLTFVELDRVLRGVDVSSQMRRNKAANLFQSTRRKSAICTQRMLSATTVSRPCCVERTLPVWGGGNNGIRGYWIWVLVKIDTG